MERLVYDVYVRSMDEKVQEQVLSYEGFKVDRQLNDSWSLSFTSYLSDISKPGFDLLQVENIIVYQGQKYVIKEPTFVDEYTKEITAQHIAWEFQNHALDAPDDDDQKSVKYTLDQYLSKCFAGNVLGYSYKIHGSFPTITFDSEIGGKNGIEMVKEAVEQFGCIFYPDNRTLHFYDTSSFYKKSEIVLRYLFNTKDVKVSVNTNELRTRIKAYGKKKSTNGKYSISKAPDALLTGNWRKIGTWYAEDPTTSTSFSTQVKVDYEGDSVYFNLKQAANGGIVRITFDGKIIGDYSQWAPSSKTKQITIDKSASKGSHTLKVAFLKEDPDHKMKVKTVKEYETVFDPQTGKKKRVEHKVEKRTPNRLYLAAEKSTVSWAVLNTSGKNKYYAYITYTSPNAEKWGVREANSVSDERFTDNESLTKYAKSQIQDEPETSLELTYTGTEEITMRDSVKFIHEPMGYDTELKPITISAPHPSTGEPIAISFSNTKKDIIKIQRRIAKLASDANKKATSGINSISILQNSISNVDSDLDSEVVGEVED